MSQMLEDRFQPIDLTVTAEQISKHLDDRTLAAIETLRENGYSEVADVALETIIRAYLVNLELSRLATYVHDDCQEPHRKISIALNQVDHAIAVAGQGSQSDVAPKHWYQ